METDFTKWFETFWVTYPKDLLHNTKGPKEGPWVSKLKKIYTPEKGEQILSALREQMRYRRKLKDKNEHKSKWCMPMVSVWCNQCRWSEEIPSFSEMNQKPKVKYYKSDDVKKAKQSTGDKWLMEARKQLYGK